MTLITPVDRIEHLSPVQARTLSHALHVLREFYDPPAIFLFGSTAKGANTPKSDIDLLVRMESDKPRHRRAASFRDVFREAHPRIDVTCFTDEEIAYQLLSRHSFLSSVLHSARPLYVRDPQREPLLRHGDAAVAEADLGSNGRSPNARH